MSAQYDTPDCASRFTLTGAWYGSAPNAPIWEQIVRLTFAKHFEGDFELLPRVTIVQPGQTETTSTAIVFPYREKRKAVLVGANLEELLPGFMYTIPKPEWTHADIEIQIEAPGAMMELRRPFEWSSIEVTCD